MSNIDIDIDPEFETKSNFIRYVSTKFSFQPKYKPTVEDLYSQDFQIGDSTLKVDFLDTAGDDQFPVMRRLSISSGSNLATFIDLLLIQNGKEVNKSWITIDLTRLKILKENFLTLSIQIKQQSKLDSSLSGHAFLLVYSITCPDSLKMIHTRLEEIKSQRSDFKVSRIE